MELKFAQIDAKDDIYCGYRVVGVHSEKYGDKRGPRSSLNASILTWVEEEYLRRLHELQVEMKKKYEPMLGDDTDKEQEPWEDTVINERVLAYRKLYHHLFYT